MGLSPSLAGSQQPRWMISETAWLLQDTSLPAAISGAVTLSILKRAEGPLGFPHIFDNICKVLPHGKPSSLGCDWESHLSIPECEEAMHWCPRLWSTGIGMKNIPGFREAFLRHLCGGYIPERCATRVKILTDRIAKLHAYPAAYGGFSDVWSCQLRRKQKPFKKVAVKAIRPLFASKEEFQVKRKAVEQELSVWVKLKHRNVLPLYGITDGFGPFPAFVCPWADNGTLSEYLEKFETRLDLKDRMALLDDVAAGLQYLHSRNIVHGDLSGSNILINKSGRACLSDFGLSILVERVSDATVTGISFPGNIRWAAPELFDECGEGRPASQLSSSQADIYSFGSITLQTLSGKPPFHGIQRVAQIVIMISRGCQPPREPGWDGRDIPEGLWEFVQACWEKNPCKRPSSEKIVSFIGSWLSRL